MRPAAARAGTVHGVGSATRAAGLLGAALALLMLGACERADDRAAPPAGNAPAAANAAPEETPEAFIARINAELETLQKETGAAAWVRATYITQDTAAIAAKATERSLAFQSAAVEQAKRYEGVPMSPETARAIELLKLGTSMPAPNDAAKRAELAEVVTRMRGAYGAGKYCPQGPESCRDLTQLEQVLAESRDPAELLDAWAGWHGVGAQMRDDYTRFVTLANEGARELGFADLGVMWRSGYDMSAEEFEQESERLWQQVKPLYDALHCHVRAELSEHYGVDVVPGTGPIPAHMLGNMWAQDWANVYEFVEPYPGVQDLDVTSALERQEYTPVRMVELAESFFVSLGLPELPDTFWERSMFTKPRDRDVQCHASAWPLDGGRDVRIKQCIEPNEDELFTVYHELGHIYYYLAYKDQPPLFQGGAHDGFHEGIGDTINLSMTPAYMHAVGLVKDVSVSDEAVINQQMKLALQKIAFLPFGKLIDQWRWDVFAGRIPPEQYNAAWWALREQYQGVAAPVARSEADFDPGAKYHIPNNTPYSRYFLAHILQFQFHRALCAAAGYEGPLHACSIHGNTQAGERLRAMLALGQSRPWQDALEQLTGSREMDASAIIDYFAPLMEWLRTQNEGRTCGW
jgi:peptidyl-dipeptidase A